MTTCTPLKPFRCWQCRKGEPVPEWVAELRSMSGCQNPIDTDFDGYWFVEQKPFEPAWCWYTPAEFAERFKVTE
jgi:hypothetical protein